MARVLLVDDDPAVLPAFSMLISSEGHAVETAKDAGEACRKLQQPGPEYDVIVTDMVMENELSGLDVLKFVGERFPFTPVIVLTGFAGVEDSKKSMDAGAFSYLAKRGEQGEGALLLAHIQRAIEYRTGLLLTRSPFFDSLDHALDVLTSVQTCLNTVVAELKSLSDARKRVLRKAGIVVGDAKTPEARQHE